MRSSEQLPELNYQRVSDYLLGNAKTLDEMRQRDFALVDDVEQEMQLDFLSYLAAFNPAVVYELLCELEESHPEAVVRDGVREALLAMRPPHNHMFLMKLMTSDDLR